MLAISFPNGTIELWRLDGTSAGRLGPPGPGCTESKGLVRFIDNNTVLTTCDTTIFAFSLSGDLLWTQAIGFNLSSFIESMSLSADGRYIAVRYPQPIVAVWDLMTHERIIIPVDDDSFRWVSMSGDGGLVAATGSYARFFRMDYVNGTYREIFAERVRSDAEACRDIDAAVVSLAGTWNGSARQGEFLKVTFGSGAPAKENVSIPRYNDEREPWSPYQSERVFVSHNCRYVAWLTSLRWTWSDPNATARLWSVPILHVGDVYAPNAATGSLAGPAVLVHPENHSGLPPEGAVWLTGAFVGDDGSAISVSTNLEWYSSQLNARIWVAITAPNATLPTIVSEYFSDPAGGGASD